MLGITGAGDVVSGLSPQVRTLGALNYLSCTFHLTSDHLATSRLPREGLALWHDGDA